MANEDGAVPPDHPERRTGVPRSVKVLLAIAGAIVLGILLLDAIALLGHL